MAARLFLGPLVVEGDEVLQDVVLGEALGPAIGFGHGGVDAVVDVLEQAHQPVLVDLLILARDPLASAKLFEGVIHLGQGQLGVLCLPFLAVRIEFLAELAKGGALGGGEVGEGEGVEAARLVVAGAIFESASLRKGPCDMDSAGEDCEEFRVFQTDSDDGTIYQIVSSTFDLEQFAEVVRETLKIGNLTPTGRAPAGNKFVDVQNLFLPVGGENALGN